MTDRIGREEVVDGDLFIDEEGRTFIAEWKGKPKTLTFRNPGGPIYEPKQPSDLVYTASDFIHAIKSLGLKRKKK